MKNVYAIIEAECDDKNTLIGEWAVFEVKSSTKHKWEANILNISIESNTTTPSGDLMTGTKCGFGKYLERSPLVATVSFECSMP